ncbi:hypothetical protein AYI69_g6770 [Smittium culicis]|uniref:Uncharacterized protein n=1 Tax=Smittium culicis TaxID=133412 RepID=A0A1R1XWY6_9FUNG|nr:hypothetical protein AYI69_g6770 [Smittium culicis]
MFPVLCPAIRAITELIDFLQNPETISKIGQNSEDENICLPGRYFDHGRFHRDDAEMSCELYMESSVDFGSSSSCQLYTLAFLEAQELGSIEIEVMEVDGDTDKTRNP